MPKSHWIIETDTFQYKPLSPQLSMHGKNQYRPTYKQLSLCVQFWDESSSPVKKTVGESVCSNSPAVLESNRNHSPTARTPVPAN